MWYIIWQSNGNKLIVLFFHVKNVEVPMIFGIIQQILQYIIYNFATIMFATAFFLIIRKIANIDT